ncbi:MAG: hypothetical protein AAF611_03095 [Bacteroidota bacterium]
MKNINTDQFKDFVEDVIRRCHEDDSFKDRLIENPVSVVNEDYNLFLKNDTTQLIVEDQSDENIIYINIPKRIDFDDIQLTEEELERVAGGATTSFVCGAIIGGLLWDGIKEFAAGVEEGWNYKN